MEKACSQFKIPRAFRNSRQNVGTKPHPARGGFAGTQSINAATERDQYFIRRQRRQLKESPSRGCAIGVGQAVPLMVPEAEKTLDH